MKKILVVAIVMLLFTDIMNAEKIKSRVLDFDINKVKKDLKNSIQGVDAESFEIGKSPWGINLRVLLNEQRDEFKTFMNKIGRPTLRMMDISRYSWRGPDATDALRGYKGSKEWWYSPKQLHEFCRASNIRLMGYFDICKLYNPNNGKVTSFYNKKTREFKITSQQMDALVEENLYKLRWVKKHGYLDLYDGWEIGSENYIRNQNTPEIYVDFVKKMTAAAKKVDPNIRLAINIFVCATDDDNLFNNTGINPREIKGKGEQDVYNKWLAWSNTVMTLLDKTAKEIYYVSIHLYGPSLRYNANAKGINTHVRIVKRYPNMRHARFIVTEWRHSGSGELSKHRQFKTAGLWKAKFAMVMLAHPLMDSTGVHDFLTYSGTGYWSDGKIWRSQWENLKPMRTFKDSEAKSRLEIGPFGPVLGMLNKIVREYPLLLEHKADLGEYSSAYFHTRCTPETKNKNAGRDLEWIVAANRKKNEFAGIAVNTHRYPIRIILQSGEKKYKIMETRSEYCPADKIFECEIPGEPKFWKFEKLKVNSDGSVVLPALSINFFKTQTQK